MGTRALSAAGRAALPLAAFLAVVALADFADWGEGPTRAAALAVAGLALAHTWRSPPAVEVGTRPWLALALVVALWRTVPVAAELRTTQSTPNDIAWTTVRALEVIEQGRSPYAADLDGQQDRPRRDPGLGWFAGYKYGPAVPRFYGPFLRALGVPRGVYAGNLLLLAATAALGALLAARAGGGAAALAAAAAVLWPGLVRYELFTQGVNDLLPTALALAALLAAVRGQGLAAGLLVGLSLAAKPLPGGLVLLLLPGTVRAGPLAAGLALGLAAYVPDLLAAPRELVANVLLFPLLRPCDTTGLCAALPRALRWLPQLAGGVAAGVVVVRYHRGHRTGRDLVHAAAIAATAFMAGGKLIHRNYLLWWLPLAAVAVATSFYRSPAFGSAEARLPRPARAPVPALGTPP
jgi:hypothetical protein